MAATGERRDGLSYLKSHSHRSIPDIEHNHTMPSVKYSR